MCCLYTWNVSCLVTRIGCFHQIYLEYRKTSPVCYWLLTIESWMILCRKLSQIKDASRSAVMFFYSSSFSSTPSLSPYANLKKRKWFEWGKKRNLLFNRIVAASKPPIALIIFVNGDWREINQFLLSLGQKISSGWENEGKMKKMEKKTETKRSVWDQKIYWAIRSMCYSI